MKHLFTFAILINLTMVDLKNQPQGMYILKVINNK
jgi:hypothetical protein